MPSPKSSATLIHDLGQELLTQGHSVSIITTSETLDTSYSLSFENGLEILRIKTGKVDGANLIVRFFNELLLSYTILYKGRNFFSNKKCDLILWYSPSIFFSYLIKKLKSKYKCSAYLILRDIFPQWALDTGVLRKGFVFNLLSYFERQQYKYADKIGVQSPNNLLYFSDKKLADIKKIEVLYNWISLENRNIVKTRYRDLFNLSGKIVFFYGGNIGVAQDLDNVVNLAKRLSSYDQARILLVGEGSEVNRLKKLIVELDLLNIIISNSVSQDEYFAMLAEFDVGLISLDRKFKTHNFPGKMLGYMYCSKPILASINAGNDLQNIIEDYSIGLSSINGDDEIFFSNALKFINDFELRRIQGANGNMLLHKLFSVKSAANQILSHFDLDDLDKS